MDDREMVDIFSDLKSLVYLVFSYPLKLECSRSRTDEVCMLRKRALSRLISAFLYLLRKRALSKQNVANWWPNRADMVENLILGCQLRSRRDQQRQKLATLTKKSCFWYLLQRRALKKQKMQIYDQTAQILWKISSRDANSGANDTNIDGNY